MHNTLLSIDWVNACPDQPGAPQCHHQMLPSINKSTASVLAKHAPQNELRGPTQSSHKVVALANLFHRAHTEGSPSATFLFTWHLN